jgi:cation-transporting P-type ATPase 13A2
MSQVSPKTILIRALDLITVVVPPALPATLSIGTSFALSRLRKLGIFCISPNRVNVAGKINVICFDKTGTLTEEGLDILGVRIPERSGDRFGELVEDARDLPLSSAKTSFLYGIATCHSLKVVGEDTIGDPLDMKMFSFTDWTLEEGDVSKKAALGKDIGKQNGERSTSLVQFVVRPPGTAQFRLEDAMKAGRRVRRVFCL